MTLGEQINIIANHYYMIISQDLSSKGFDSSLGVSIIDIVRSKMLDQAYLEATIDLSNAEINNNEKANEKIHTGTKEELLKEVQGDNRKEKTANSK